MKWGKTIAMSGALIVVAIFLQGCAVLFVAGVAGAAAAGTVSYVGNEVRAMHEVSLDKAWGAANATMRQMGFEVYRPDTIRDAMQGKVTARNGAGQSVIITVIRQTETVTEVRVRVGTFNTVKNREASRQVYDTLKTQL